VMPGAAGLAPTSLHGSVAAALTSQRSLLSGADSQAAALQLQGGVPTSLSPGSLSLGPLVATGVVPAALASKPQLLIPTTAALVPTLSTLPGHMLPLGMGMGLPAEALLPAAAFPLEVATN
jgi:hypothetical protein